MNRLFGSKNAAPKPGLNEAIASTEQRADGVTQKIKKLDQELARYRDQMKKMSSGPGKVCRRTYPRTFWMVSRAPLAYL